MYASAFVAGAGQRFVGVLEDRQRALEVLVQHHLVGAVVGGRGASNERDGGEVGARLPTGDRRAGPGLGYDDRAAAEPPELVGQREAGCGTGAHQHEESGDESQPDGGCGAAHASACRARACQ